MSRSKVAHKEKRYEETNYVSDDTRVLIAFLIVKDSEEEEVKALLR